MFVRFNGKVSEKCVPTLKMSCTNFWVMRNPQIEGCTVFILVIRISLNIFKRVDLSPVSFTETNHQGIGIFRQLIQGTVTNQNHPLLPSLVSGIEKIFFYLISVAEKTIGREKVDRIIESPDVTGQTVGWSR